MSFGDVPTSVVIRTHTASSDAPPARPALASASSSGRRRSISAGNNTSHSRHSSTNAAAVDMNEADENEEAGTGNVTVDLSKRKGCVSHGRLAKAVEWHNKTAVALESGCC